MTRSLRIILCALLGLLCAASPAAEPTPEELNGIAGIPLFGSVRLWDERPAAVIRRLNVNCRAESSGGGQMFAAPIKRLVFGCPAAELRIFAVGGKVTRVDIFLVNKGDSAFGRKRRSTIKNELRRADAALEKLLRKHFGKPVKHHFGSGALRRQLPVWTCGGHALIVDFVDGEYLMIRLVPPETPGGRRRGKGGGDRAESGKNYSANVVRRPSGDVFIDNVPMVNQGRKGYCVPATVERVLRYFGVADVDMHNLAEKYKTGVGGKTRADRMMHGSKRLLGEYGLRMREVGALKRHTLVRNIDQGLPVLWFHFATDEFRRRLDHSLKSRKRATPEGWKRILASQKRLRQQTSNPHVALVIGYNRDTDEFAVSNSWGDQYRIAWVRYADMQQVDAKLDLFVVQPRKQR